MAFPTLFPDGKGDPTNSATMRDVTLGDKIKHLIKFAEYIRLYIGLQVTHGLLIGHSI